ncbi:TOM1-like protein 9 isoform X2 [Andrographis paniculata]|nr:TOM1-like protein 9 isoform X2 [Andrographis paniculata]
MKNCGDIVHKHVARKDLPHEMVKAAKKKLGFQVKEKILTLIDTWQEAFGGPRAKYPQYFIAYLDLLRLGAVFPQKLESSAPVFTPPQTHPLSSNPQHMHNSELSQKSVGSSADTELPTLSLTELQRARSIMEVLTEMLNALDPGNIEGLKQEVVVDLVDQCRTYKRRVAHLINSTSDESLLSQALALNDDLQCLLAKHGSIACGAVSSKIEQPRPELSRALVPSTTNDAKQPEKGTTTSPSTLQKQLLPPALTTGVWTTPSKPDPQMDLLSGDDFNSSTESSLALVPSVQPHPAIPISSEQNALALVDLFSENNNSQSLDHGQACPSSSQMNFNPPLLSNGSIVGPMLPRHEQSLKRLPSSPVYGADNTTALPPPPWEAELDSSMAMINQPSPRGAYDPGSLPMSCPRSVVMYPQPMQAGPTGYVYPQQMYGSSQMVSFGPSTGCAYGYGYPQHIQFVRQGIPRQFLRGSLAATSSPPSSGSENASRPEDRLFEDLVDMSKFRHAKTV